MLSSEVMRFIPGLQLNELFYHEVVAPLLEHRYPSLSYSAGLIGYGSDVLGFDTPVSMDHNWGPRLQIFLSASDARALATAIGDYLKEALPFEFRGFPTNFSPPRYDGTQSMERTDSHPVNHLIEVTTVEAYVGRHLGLKSIDDVSSKDWIALDDEKLLEITAGKIFHDGPGTLTATRQKFRFYPPDVLLFRLAQQWRSIEEDEPLIGRTIDLQTYDGTKILAGRLVEACLKICMYLDDRYPPYRKWLYRSFQSSSFYPEVHPLMMEVLFEDDPRRIEDRLCALDEGIVQIHNRRPNLPHLDNRTRNFFNRPYKVIFAETIVEALKQAISDPQIRNALH